MNKPTVKQEYIRPFEANSLLKNARQTKRTVYVWGGAGYGKTSLVISHLGRRRFEYLSAEDLEEFEKGLDEAVAEAADFKESIVVMDDLHMLETKELRDMYLPRIRALSASKCTWLVLISRAELGGWLKPLHIEDMFMLVGEPKLAMTSEDIAQYFENMGVQASGELVSNVSDLGGYPIYARCVAMRLMESQSGTVTNVGAMEDAVMKNAYEDLLDYLDSAVLDQWPLDLKEFFVQMSVVDSFDVDMARQITRRNEATALILRGTEMGAFLTETTENGVATYTVKKGMLDAFRRELSRSKSRRYIDKLLNSAGTAYEIADNVPAALEMYEKSGDEEDIYRLLLACTRRHAGVAKYYELRKHFLALDEDSVRRSPDLMKGMSLLHSIILNDEESERWYAELEAYAKASSGRAKRSAQEMLFYLDIALPHRTTTSLLSAFKNAKLFFGDRGFLSDVNLTNNSPSIINGGNDFSDWSKRDEEIQAVLGRAIEFVLGRVGKGLMGLALSETNYLRAADNYEVVARIEKGRIEAESGGGPQQLFVVAGLSARLAIMNGRIDDALEIMNSYRTSIAGEAKQLFIGIDAFVARIHMYMGAYDKVVSWLDTGAPDEDAGFCSLDRYLYMIKARAYLATGQKEKAVGLLNLMLAFAEKRGRTHIHIEANILLAIAKYRLGNEGWKEHLQAAITEAEEFYFVRLFSEEGPALVELFAKADFVWTDEAMKAQVLEECQRMATTYPKYMRQQTNDVALSETAIRILRLMDKGYTIAEIADELHITPAGVKYYNTETYKKLNVRGKTEALREARDRRIL